VFLAAPETRFLSYQLSL